MTLAEWLKEANCRDGCGIGLGMMCCCADDPEP